MINASVGYGAVRAPLRGAGAVVAFRWCWRWGLLHSRLLTITISASRPKSSYSRASALCFFRPTVLQAHRAVEDEFALRRIGVDAEIALALELEGVAGLCAADAGLDHGGNDLERFGVEVIHVVA